MAYVTPYTFVALSTLTAAQLNSIQSNILALWPYTAAGDIPYASSPSVLSALAKGSNGNSLCISPVGVPAWSGLACAKLYIDTPVSINNSTDYIIQFDQEITDNYGYADISTHPTRITVPATTPAAKYLVFGHTEWESSTQYEAKILQNGSLYFRNSIIGRSTNFIFFSINDINCYYEIQVKHTYGSALNLSNAEFNIIKIG